MYGDSELRCMAKIGHTTRLNWKIDSPLMTINSSDHYTFAYNAEEDKISAGCRYLTYDEAVKHWTLTRGGTPLGEERLMIIKVLRAHYRPDLMGGEVPC